MKKSTLTYTVYILISLVFVYCGKDDPQKPDAPEANPPTILSFNPTQGNVGISVIIKGTNFSATPSENIVKFNGTKATVIDASTTELTATVPSGATDGTISVEVGGEKVTSTATFAVTTTPPVELSVTGFNPQQGVLGTIVAIEGTGFSSTEADNIVEFNGVAATVNSATSDQLQVTVPYGATTGTISISVNNETVLTTGNFTVPKPTITSFSPEQGTAGTEVVIVGTNFSPSVENNVVEFNGASALIIDAEATQLTVNVPEEATSGKITVSVGGQEVESTDDFVIPAAPTITSFSPNQGKGGTEVTIIGTAFSDIPENNTVRFNGTEVTVVNANSTQLLVQLPPEGATTGNITVTVNGHEVESEEVFTVGPWKELAEFPGAHRQQAVIAVVEDGNGDKKIVCGLGWNSEKFHSDLWSYDIQNDNWEQLTSFPDGARYGAFSFVLNNLWYVGSGYDGFLTNEDDTWVYNPIDGSWSIEEAFNSELKNANSFVIQDKAYVYGGGYNSDSNASPFLNIFDPQGNPKWSLGKSLTINENGRSVFAAFSLDGKGYVSTGHLKYFNNHIHYNDLWEFDPAGNGTWTQKADYPGGKTRGAIGFAIGGYGYVGLGSDENNNYKISLRQYNPNSNTWSLKTGYPASGRVYSSVVVSGEKAYIIFGNSGNEIEDKYFMEYNPLYDN